MHVYKAKPISWYIPLSLSPLSNLHLAAGEKTTPLSMTQTQAFFSFFFCFILFSLAHSLHPKQLQKQHFQVLNVSESVHKTRQIFSKPTSSSQTNEQKPKFSSVLSFSLHPQASVFKPQHKNYSAVTLSRLAFDSARVNSIKSKLQLTLLKPDEIVIQPEDLQSPVISGKKEGTFEYLARVGLGRPVKEYYMAIDTGSDVNWLQCQPCDFCYEQSDPIFDPSGSSSYNRLSCASQQCGSLQENGCSGDTCRYYVSYGDGSFTYGDLATETVTFGGSGSVQDVAIGCGHDNEGLFHGLAGLIGLGSGPLSLPSQIKATSFSYCLVDMDSHSSSTLEFNSAPLSDSIVIPLIYNSKFKELFYVELIGISVEGEKLSISPSIFQINGDGSGGVIIDSGTVVTRLVTEAYNSLRDTFVKYAKNLPLTSGYSLFDTCYDLSSIPGGDVKVPTVSFHFSGGKTLSLTFRNCMIPVDSHGKFCFAFAPSDSISIIGNIQQQETRVSFDLSKKLIGFSPDKC